MHAGEARVPEKPHIFDILDWWGIEEFGINLSIGAVIE
jgi:hypothetical protein